MFWGTFQGVKLPVQTSFMSGYRSGTRLNEWYIPDKRYHPVYKDPLLPYASRLNYFLTNSML